MNQDSNKLRGYYLTILIIILVLSIWLATYFGKTLFVYETGNIGFAKGLIPLLSIGLLFKLKYLREILSIIYSLSLIMMLFILFLSNQIFFISNLILTIAICIICYLLIFSRDVKLYVESKN